MPYVKGQSLRERLKREQHLSVEAAGGRGQAIAKALRVVPSYDEKCQIEKPRALNIEAYDFYRRGS